MTGESSPGLPRPPPAPCPRKPRDSRLELLAPGAKETGTGELPSGFLGASAPRRDLRWCLQAPASARAPGGRGGSGVRTCPEPRRLSSGAHRCRAALSLILPLAGAGSGGVQGCCRSWLAREGRGAGCGERQTPSLLDGKCACPCYFWFSLPPRAGALWCKRSHRAPPGTVAAPFGVSRSQLTMEKTTPSLPAMCFCSQKYFYSNIHLFTTWDLRGFCFLFGFFFFFLKDAF